MLLTSTCACSTCTANTANEGSGSEVAGAASCDENQEAGQNKITDSRDYQHCRQHAEQ